MFLQGGDLDKIYIYEPNLYTRPGLMAALYHKNVCASNGASTVCRFLPRPLSSRSAGARHACCAPLPPPLTPGLRECDVTCCSLPAGLLELELQLLVAHELPDDDPGARQAEEVGGEHDDGEGAVEGGALLWQQQEVDVDGQLREQGEEPVADELGHLVKFQK